MPQTEFGLSPDEVRTIKHIFDEVLGVRKYTVWIFGSRATATQRPNSDIDLLLSIGSIGPQTDKSLVYELKDKFIGSNLPYFVDLVLLEDLAPAYAQQVHESKRLFISRP